MLIKMSFEQKQYFRNDEEFQKIYGAIDNKELRIGLWKINGPTAGFDEDMVIPEIKLKLAGHKYFMNTKHKIQDTLEYEQMLGKVYEEAYRTLAGEQGLDKTVDTEGDKFNKILNDLAYKSFIKKYSY